MVELFGFFVFIAVWIVMQKFILPVMGVKT